MLNRGEQKRRTSVHYILGALLYDNLDTVKRVVNQEVRDIGTCRKLSKQLEAFIEFLKLNYSRNIGLGRDSVHDTIATLHGDCTGADPDLTSSCSTCLALFQVLADFEAAVDKNNGDIEDAILKAKDRLNIYMGHVHPAVHQDRGIANVMDSIRSDAAESTVLTVADYRMKLQQV